MIDTLDLIHMKIHGLRMIPKYKPTQFEQEVNYLIADEFTSVCAECRLKEKELSIKAELKQLQPQQQKTSFLGGLLR